MNKMFRIVPRAARTGMVVLASMAAAVSHAAVDASVTTALSDGKTDVGTIGAAVFAIILVVALYKWFKRAL
ncbi:MAG: phage coat protein [Ramlibacter sp.]|nr:phage coat protein [Ramlibacter sp.]